MAVFLIMSCQDENNSSNFIDGNDTLLDRCGFLDVIETEDGGYAALGYHRYSHASGLKESLLVRMDKNGCVAGYDCGVDTMIVRSSLVSVSDAKEGNKPWTIFPNPTSDFINIANLSPEIDRIAISDMIGNVIYTQLIAHENKSLQGLMISFYQTIYYFPPMFLLFYLSSDFSSFTHILYQLISTMLSSKFCIIDS